MKTTTHIAGLTELATAIYEYRGQAPHQTRTPVLVLSSYVSLEAKSHKFTRLLTWLIAFYQESIETISRSSLSDKNKSTAEANLRKLYTPLLPPFTQTDVETWYKQAMSDTDQSYFDLLSDNLIKEHPIYVPEHSDLTKFEADLREVLLELHDLKLPHWIERDFEESISLTIIAVTKMPYVAHRLIQECHSSVLARLFSVATPEQRKFVVRVATIMNVVLAAFVMPHEATDAAQSYYGWVLDSPIDTKQIEACAQPLALPAPAKKHK